MLLPILGMQVFYPGSSKPVFFVASRGHHADIGGTAPGTCMYKLEYAECASHSACSLFAQGLVTGLSLGIIVLTRVIIPSSRCLRCSAKVVAMKHKLMEYDNMSAVVGTSSVCCTLLALLSFEVVDLCIHFCSHAQSRKDFSGSRLRVVPH